MDTGNTISKASEELRAVRDAILKLTTDPTTSTSVSSANGGSYSASYVDLDRLYRRERELVARIAELLRGGSLGMAYPVYC